MQFEDLYQFPAGHAPNPYNFPPEEGDLMLPAGLTMYAVGWLEEPGFPTGDVPAACIDGLVAALADKIIPDGTRGWHTCTFTGEDMPKVTWKDQDHFVTGHGNYLVRLEDKVYMAPAMLLHYIVNLNYSPPTEFCDAVINGAFMGVDDLDVKKKAE